MAGLMTRSTAVRSVRDVKAQVIKLPAAMMLAGLIASAALLGGCGEDESAARAREVTNRVTLLTSAGQQMVSVESRRFVELREIRDELQRLVKEGNINPISLKLLEARVIEQMGNVIAGLAAEKEQEAVLLGARVLTLADVYRRQSAIASAAGRASLAEDIARLTADKAAVIKRANDLDGQRTELSATVSATQQKIDGLLSRAKTMHEQATVVRTQASGASAVAALQAGEQAALINRQADELDRQAAYLTAENGRLTPAVTEKQAEAAGLREGAVRVTAAITSLEARQKLVRDEAAAMTKAMTETGTDAQAAADVLLALHAAQESGAIKSRVEQAKSVSAENDALRDAVKDASLGGVLSLAELYYNAAGGAAKTLGADVAADQRKSAANVSISVSQALADLKLLEGRSKQRLAAAMAAVATLMPAVAKQPSYQAQSEAAVKDAEAAMKEARTAYGELKEKVSGLGGDEARLARLAATLDKLAKGETAPQPAPAPAAKSDGAAAPGADITAEIQPLLVKLIEANRTQNMPALAAITHFKDDGERKLFDAAMRMATATLALDAACKEKFSKSFADVLKGDPIMGPMAAGFGNMAAEQEKSKSWKPDQFKVKAKGATEATVQIPGQENSKTELIKISGQWMLKVPAAMSSPQMAMMNGPTGDAVIGVFGSLAADIKAGKITDEKQVGAEFGKKMMALQGLMGGGGK